MTVMRVVAAAGVAAAASGVALSVLRRTPVAARFERTNHRGDRVTMLEGPAYAIGAIAGILVGPASGPTSGSVRAGALVATVGAGVFGTIDDVAERPPAQPEGIANSTGPAAKGFRGHLGALRRGRLTTGGAKMLGISAAGFAAAACAVPRRAGGGTAGRVVDVVLAGGVIAGSANLVNLLDLRPGRALKAVAIASAGQAAMARGTRENSGLLAAGLGAGAAMLPGDLRETSMLGDAGANTAGALLGVHLVASTPRWGRAMALVAIAAATIASEKISFTSVIASTPVLRRLDELGRRPL